MSAKVYYTDMHVRMGDSLLAKFDRLITRAGIEQIDFKDKFVAVKLHFGEVGNMAFLRQQYARVLCDHVKRLGGKPFLTDCNTLYVGYRNNALNRYERNTAKKRGGPAGTLCLEELGECVSGKDDLHDRIDYEHLVTSINSFLSLLSKEQRIIFVRRYFYESSIREIAEDYGLSESKVKVTLSRLRKRLRESLEKEGIQV